MKIKFILSFVLCGICMFIFYKASHYYAEPKPRSPYSLSSSSDTINIAYIGDSWAFLHKDHECIISKKLEDTLKQPVKVYSFGICGLTSREIYENIFDNNELKQFFQKRNYKYCYISAGINDTYKKMTLSYYEKSMDYIIQFLLNNHIHPIIQEIPDYDIQKAYSRQHPARKILRKMSMLITGTTIDCKQQYRNALDNLIQKKGYTNKISIIRYKSWNNNYIQDLNTIYAEDGMHLNHKGYAVLDSVIAEDIVQKYNSN